MALLGVVDGQFLVDRRNGARFTAVGADAHAVTVKDVTGATSLVPIESFLENFRDLYARS